MIRESGWRAAAAGGLLTLLGCWDSGTGLCKDANGGQVYLFVKGNEVTDLTPVAEYSCLLSIYIEETRISDLSPLVALPSLGNLTLGDNPLLGSIAPLASAPRLEVLTLRMGAMIGDLDQLRESPLLDLTLDKTNAADVRKISALTGLKSLTLREVPIDTLAPLAALKQLESLYLLQLPAEDPAFLADLSMLSIFYCADTKIATLEPLRNLPGLRKISLTRCEIADLEPLRGKKTIQSLRLAEFIDPPKLEVLETFLERGDTLYAGTSTGYPYHVPPATVDRLRASGVIINP